MLNILIAEGTPAVWQAERAGFGLPSNLSLLAAAVRLHCPEIRYLVDFIRSSKRGVGLRRPSRRLEEVVED